MPRLDPAPVDLRVDRPHGPEATAPDQGRGRLLGLAEKRRWRATETESTRRGEVDELARFARAEGEGLLAVDVATGLEGLLRDRVVGVVNRQVDDDVDLVVREEVLECRVGSAAIGRSERPCSFGIQVRDRDEPDLGVGEGIPGITARDVPGSDDSDAEGLDG